MPAVMKAKRNDVKDEDMVERLSIETRADRLLTV
jgi:hypothetical protein